MEPVAISAPIPLALLTVTSRLPLPLTLGSLDQLGNNNNNNNDLRMPSLRQIVASQLHIDQRNGAGTDHHQQNETADMCLQCGSSSYEISIITPGDTATEAGAAANQAATNKIAKYDELASTHIFYIVAIETGSTWSQWAVELVQEICRRATLITGEPRESTSLFQQLCQL